MRFLPLRLLAVVLLTIVPHSLGSTQDFEPRKVIRGSEDPDGIPLYWAWRGFAQNIHAAVDAGVSKEYLTQTVGLSQLIEADPAIETVIVQFGVEAWRKLFQLQLRREEWHGSEETAILTSQRYMAKLRPMLRAEVNSLQAACHRLKKELLAASPIGQEAWIAVTLHVRERRKTMFLASEETEEDLQMAAIWDSFREPR